MKQLYKSIALITTLVLTGLLASPQSRLVMNGASITMQGGASLVIDNPDNAAITYNGGYIETASTADKLIWHIGSGNGNTYIFPFGNASHYLPVQLTVAGGTGAGGQLVMSTYSTSSWKNSDDLPDGVTNINRNGADNSAKVVDRFWQIDAQGYTSKPTLSNIIFTYNDADLAAPNAIIESGLIPQSWNSTSSSWSDYTPAPTVNTTTNTVTIPSVAGIQLSQWWTLVDASFALPLSLIGFTATLQDRSVLLSWQTVFEANTDHFEVHRSKDQLQFDSIDRVNSAGFSSGIRKYSLTDKAPYSGANYYRLKSVDKDGKFTWSSILKVVTGADASVSVYPNPASSYINLSVNSMIVAAKPVVQLYDVKGSLLQSFVITNLNTVINTGSLTAGLYFIHFTYDNQPRTLTFIKK